MSYEVPDNNDDVIDSRSIIERIQVIEAELAEAEESPSEYTDAEELAEELALLQAFAEEASEVSDWSYGETFVRDSYFGDYARELAEEVGAIDSDAKWPANHIDWEAAADALKGDYTPYEFDGVRYWARA